MGWLRRSKGAPIHEWPREQVLSQIVASYCAANHSKRHVRASVILHQPLDLLPRGEEERAREEWVDEEWSGFPEYLCFYLDFDDDDRHGLYMDGDVSCLVRGWFPSPSEKACRKAARRWIKKGGEKAEEVPFNGLPGIYQAAVMAQIRNERPMADMTWNFWCPLTGQGDLSAISDGEVLMIRDYPPRLDDEYEAALEEGRSIPEDDRVWVLMPVGAIREMYADRPW